MFFVYVFEDTRPPFASLVILALVFLYCYSIYLYFFIFIIYLYFEIAFYFDREWEKTDREWEKLKEMRSAWGTTR